MNAPFGAPLTAP